MNNEKRFLDRPVTFVGVCSGNGNEHSVDFTAEKVVHLEALRLTATQTCLEHKVVFTMHEVTQRPNSE